MIRLFRKNRVELEIDSPLKAKRPYQISNTNNYLDFRPIELVILLGAFQSLHKSSILSMLDYTYLKDYIDPSVIDFKIMINQLRQNYGPEGIGQVSTDLGHGFALITLKKLLNTQPKNIKKIIRTGTRPDFEAQSDHNHLIYAEGKGSINKSTSLKQIEKGITQKTSNTHAHFGLVSAIHIKENNISMLKLIDPEGEGSSRTKRMQAITRSQYYSGLFNFIGLHELCRYFQLMEKRLISAPEDEWIDEKEKMFNKIKDSYVRLRFNGEQYYGVLKSSDNLDVIFTGIRNDAIYYNDFLGENNIINQSQIDNDGENYFFFPESKIIIAILSDPEKFIDNYIPPEVGIWSVKDLAMSNEIVALNLIHKWLETEGAIVTFSKSKNSDLTFFYGNKEFELEYKKNLNKTVLDNLFRAQFPQKRNFLILTPVSLKSSEQRFLKKYPIFKIIDSTILEKFLTKKLSLKDFLRS